jgi:hypothetical protein
MRTQKNQPIKVWGKVTFYNDLIEIFKDETSKNYRAAKQFQLLVLKGRVQNDFVNNLVGNLTTVSYDDVRDIPVPMKSIISLAS